MEISIVLLVMFILVLVVSSLYVFSLKKDKADEKLKAYSLMEEAYVQEELIKYYVDEIYAKTGDNNELFNVELEKYKTKEGYFVERLDSCKDLKCEVIIVVSNDVARISYTFTYDPRK